MILSYFDGYPYTESEDLQETKEEYEFRKQLTKALGHYDIDFFKRLLRLETILEEKIQLYDAKLSELEAMNKGATGQGIDPEEQKPLKLNGIVATRAHLMLKYLEIKPKRFGERYLTANEQDVFLQSIIPEEYRISKNGSERHKRKAVVEKMIDMYPDEVFVNIRRRITDPKTIRLREQK